MIAIKAETYNITSSINTKRYWHSMYKIKSLYYHNAINVLTCIYYCCVTKQVKGDVSPNFRLILARQRGGSFAH